VLGVALAILGGVFARMLGRRPATA
jgi:hypothetical protein